MKRKTFAAVLVICVMTFSFCVPAAFGEGMPNIPSLYKNKDVNASWSASEAKHIDLSNLDGDSLILTEKGDYLLAGQWVGQIVIEAGEDDKVRLILNGASITSPQGPAIYEKQADKLIVTLAEDTENTLTDGPAIADGDDTIGAALYAEDDLSINGSGQLTVNGTQKHGIQSKADLIIASGNIAVTSILDGIRGRNSVLILNGSIAVTAGGDGITATRADQEDKGWIVLAGGSVTVQTGNGAGEVRVSANSKNGGGRGRNTNPVLSSGNDISQKAVKAATDLTVLGGDYSFNCADDGLHAANVTVYGGSFTILSGDDGMHADNEMVVQGGVIRISQCYEGLEGKNVTVNGGDIHIIASDDGVNASGSGDSGYGGRGGAQMTGADSSMLSVTGGSLFVSAGGDGLDSNGSISLTGGVVGVWTARTAQEGPIDFNGTGTLSGTQLIVASEGGFMQGLTGQSMMAVSLTGTMAAGTEIRLLDASGNVLAAFAPDSSFSSITVSSSLLPEGTACRVICGDQEVYNGPMSNNSGSFGTYNNGYGNGKTNRHGR